MSACWNPMELLTWSQEGLDTLSSSMRNDINREYKDLESQLAEAREEVEYAINFFNKNENFGVVGILKGIRDKLKGKGE